MSVFIFGLECVLTNTITATSAKHHQCRDCSTTQTHTHMFESIVEVIIYAMQHSVCLSSSYFATGYLVTVTGLLLSCTQPQRPPPPLPPPYVHVCERVPNTCLVAHQIGVYWRVAAAATTQCQSAFASCFLGGYMWCVCEGVCLFCLDSCFVASDTTTCHSDRFCATHLIIVGAVRIQQARSHRAKTDDRRRMADNTLLCGVFPV